MAITPKQTDIEKKSRNYSNVIITREKEAITKNITIIAITITKK